MPGRSLIGLVVPFLALFRAVVAEAQGLDAAFARNPHRLGLVDSRPTQVEVVPGVRVRGLEILGVVPGSPADRVGLKAGDVILSVGARRIVVPDDLRQALVGSDRWLRLKVYDAGTDQVLNVDVALTPSNPGPFPPPVTVMGRVKVDVLTVGGETTGITLTGGDGKTYDLDFGTHPPPGRVADSRLAVVSGRLRSLPGPERPGRRVIRVEHFRLLGRELTPGEETRAQPF